MKIKKLVASFFIFTSIISASLGMENPRRDDPNNNNRGAPASSVPTGGIIAFAGERAPDGWLLCDGQRYYSQQYPELYEAIKTRYAPIDQRLDVLVHNENNINKLFYVPDLRGRVVVGVDGGAGRITAYPNALGESSGEERHPLTVNEIPPHPHSFQCSVYPGGTFGGAIPGYKLLYKTWGDRPNDEQQITSLAGGGEAHNNMQPYQVLNYIINTGRFGNRAGADRYDQEAQQLRQDLNNLALEVRRGLHPGMAKAWVVFDGAARMLQGYNVSSVIKNAVGEYTINFSRPFASENYCSALSARGVSCTLTAACVYSFPQTRESFRVVTFHFQNGNSMDASVISACFYGNQADAEG